MPKTTNPRGNVAAYTVRLTEPEDKAISDAARAVGLTPSQYIRSAAILSATNVTSALIDCYVKPRVEQ